MIDTLENPLLEDTTPEQNKQNRFFDPHIPEIPEEVFGVDTKDVLQLGRIATQLNVLPPKAAIGLYSLPHAVRLMPLLERMQEGEELEPQDIRPYRKSIKKLHPGLNAADKLAATASIAGTGIPLRRALNRKIERDFQSRAGEVLEQARDSLSLIEAEVSFMSQFKDPQAQFTWEVNDLAQAVKTRIHHEHAVRLQENQTPESNYDIPKGIRGFITKAVRSIRNFFGRFQQKQPSPEVTAHDAGMGLEATINLIRANPESAHARLPILSRYVFSRIPEDAPITRDVLALTAPEVLTLLDSLQDKDDQKPELTQEILHNPHELRYFLGHKKHRGRYVLDTAQYGAKNLLPAIAKVLPQDSEVLQHNFDSLKSMLEYNPPLATPANVMKKTSEKVKLRTRVRNLLRRRQSTSVEA